MPAASTTFAPALRSALVTLLDAVLFNDALTSDQSDGRDVKRFRYFTLYLDIDSASTPTDVRFIVEFSPDGGTTWHEYRQGLFASLYYEDQDTASGLQVCFSGECAGRTFRLRAVATGTDATKTFTVTAKAEFWT